jgi:hypothetical protein
MVCPISTPVRITIVRRGRLTAGPFEGVDEGLRFVDPVGFL